jgi:tripartite-type tricarboxylate transporter receptor subunit TctC
MRSEEKTTRRHWLSAGLAAMASLALPLRALAQAKYPQQQPVKFIVPFPAAGAIDNIARTVGRQMALELRQAVVVENRPGAAGNIGAAAVAHAKPDGYTLLIGTSATHGANPSLFTKPGYDALGDFEPIALFGMVPNVLVVNAQKGPGSFKALLAKIKANPGKLTFASAGTGTSLHLAGVMFERASGTRLVHVPYKGGAPASLDLMAGVVDMMFDTVTVALPAIKAGKTRALAIAAAQRHPALPDVPTFAELGFKGVESGTWAGLFAPKGAPAAVVAELHRAADVSLRDPGVTETLQGMGVQIVPKSGPAFRGFVQGEIKTYAALVKAAGIAPE